MKLSPSIAPKIPISPVSFPFNFNNTAISLSDLQASVELPIGEDLNE